MKRINNRSFKSENLEKETLKKLFIKFLNSLPDLYLQSKKTIPFTIAKIALANFRINEKDAKIFLKKFVELNLLKIVKFRGYHLNFPKIMKLLEEKEIKRFCRDNAIDLKKFEKLRVCHLAFESDLIKNE